MPNWCENELTIVGDKKSLETIYKMAQAVEEKGFFKQLVPRPKSKDQDWYNWNCINWGTKWDVSIDCFYFDKIQPIKNGNGLYSIDLSFYSAWTPPEAFVKTLCKKLKVSAKLKYIETGSDFVGELRVSNKTIVFDNYQYITKESLLYFGYDMEYIEHLIEKLKE